MKNKAALISDELFRIILSLVLFALAIVFKILDALPPLIIFSALALLVGGYRVFIGAASRLIKRDFLDEKFLMSISSLGAMIIGEYLEAAAVMIFFLIGEYFEHRAVREARRSIKSLMSICPDEATVIREGVELSVDSEDIECGDILLLRAGDRVAADSVIILGSSDFDTSSITGESLPRAMGVGDELQSGFVVLSGVVQARVIRAAEQSAAMRILSLVESASDKKAREEAFITRFCRIYTPAVVIFAVIFAIVPPLFSLLTWTEAVYRALTFLVVSCPCALVISVPMAFFAGIGSAAASGILFKGGAYFSAVANVEEVLFDKTGTLTSGNLKIADIYPNGCDKEVLMGYFASLEHGSSHPIAKAVLREYQPSRVVKEQRELAGLGTVGMIDGKRIAVGNARLMEKLGINVNKYVHNSPSGIVFLALDGKYLGSVTFADDIKNEANEAISTLRSLGVKRVEILSGDSEASVKTVAKALGVNEYHAELLPEDKYRIISEKTAKRGGKVMFVGDGINDAPSLRLADVGVSFGGIAADSAVEAADLVIMSESLTKIPRAIKSARKTLRIAKENIIFAIGVKLLVIAISALGLANMWLAVFADVGVAALAILNSLRCLKG